MSIQYSGDKAIIANLVKDHGFSNGMVDLLCVQFESELGRLRQNAEGGKKDGTSLTIGKPSKDGGMAKGKITEKLVGLNPTFPPFQLYMIAQAIAKFKVDSGISLEGVPYNLPGELLAKLKSLEARADAREKELVDAVVAREKEFETGKARRELGERLVKEHEAQQMAANVAKVAAKG